MSAPTKGKQLPKRGKLLHRRSTDAYLRNYELSIAAALKAELRDSKGSVKTVMRWTGASERAVKGWFSGANGPNGRHLISLATYSDTVFTCVIGLSGRRLLVQESELVSLRSALAIAIQTIDGLARLRQ